MILFPTKKAALREYIHKKDLYLKNEKRKKTYSI